MNNKELKPCPFCGGKAEVAEHKFGFNTVYCESCGARTTAWYLPDAIETWNRRADGAKTDECCEKSCKDEK
jgi:Lar family restriction alleviation protein